MLYFLTYCNSFVIKVKRGFRIKMNRTHWVKTAAGLGAACFITIGMGFSGTDASAMTNAGVLDNYYDAGVSVGAGTSSDSTVLGMAGADNAQVNVTAATQAAISTGAAVSTQAAAVASVMPITHSDTQHSSKYISGSDNAVWYRKFFKGRCFGKKNC